MKIKFKSIFLIATIALLSSCSEDSQELKDLETNAIVKTKVENTLSSKASYQKRFYELIKLHNQKYSVTDSNITIENDKQSLSNTNVLARENSNTYNFKIKDSNYSNIFNSGYQRVNQGTQFASFVIKPKYYRGGTGSFEIKMRGTNQGFKFYLQKRSPAFGPSRGVFSLNKIESTSNVISQNVSKDEPIKVNASSDTLEITIHSNEYGYTALWVKVNGVLKYEITQQFNFVSNTNNGVSFKYTTQRKNVEFAIFAGLGWF